MGPRSAGACHAIRPFRTDVYLVIGVLFRIYCFRVSSLEVNTLGLFYPGQYVVHLPFIPFAPLLLPVPRK